MDLLAIGTVVGVIIWILGAFIVSNRRDKDDDGSNEEGNI